LYTCHKARRKVQREGREVAISTVLTDEGWGGIEFHDSTKLVPHTYHTNHTTPRKYGPLKSFNMYSLIVSLCLGIDEPLYEHYNKNLSQLVDLASDHITQVNHIYSQVGMTGVLHCLRL
jgi:hypothetical protein